MDKAILLVRVSTFSQDFEAQKNDLINYANSLGINDYHIIENYESAIELTEEERAGITDMKEFISVHPDYNVVIVWEISRLGRTEKMLHSIKDYFISNNIQLYIYDKRYKLLNDDGSENSDTALLFTLYSYFAENEMKVKKARFARAKKLNQEKGKYNGSKIKFGFALDENNYYIEDEKNANVVRWIYNQYATGKYTANTLLEEVNAKGVEMNLSTIRDILWNTCYKGYTDYDGYRRSHRKYPQIVSCELWDKVKSIRESNNINQDRSRRIRLAAKLIKCKICGYNYFQNGRNYLCVNRYFKNDKCGDSPEINYIIMDKILLFISILEHKYFCSCDKKVRNEEIKEDIEDKEMKIEFLNKEINVKLKKQSIKYSDMYVKGYIDEKTLDERMKLLKKKINESEQKILQYKHYINSQLHLMEELKSNDKINMFGDLNLQQMYEMVHRYINVVYLEKDIYNGKKCINIEVNYKGYCVDGTFEDRIRNYRYFPLLKKQKIMYEGEFVDDEINKILGTLPDKFEKVLSTRQRRKIKSEEKKEELN